MADPLHDDSSAASSGDEMLNITVPFSQHSTSPEKNYGKGSGSEDEAGVKGKQDQEPHVSSKLPGQKRKHKEIDATETKEKADANARKAFMGAYHDEKVGTPEKLLWHNCTKKRSKVIFPVRVVTREETVGLNLPAWDDATHFPIQFIQYPHKQIKGDVGLYCVASKRSLSPYYGKGENRDQWCPTKFEQYSKQLKRSLKGVEAIDLMTEGGFLHMVLQKSLEEGEQVKQRAEFDEAVPEEISTTNEDNRAYQSDSEEDEDEDTAGGSRRRTRNSTNGQEATEQLRVGERIEFYGQQSVAGDKSGLCEATILAIDPKGDRILTLDDPFTILQPEHKVKRIKRKQRGGKLVDHEEGVFRPINRYYLKKEGDPKNALGKLIAANAVRGREMIQRRKGNAIAGMVKDGIDPSLAKDLVR